VRLDKFLWCVRLFKTRSLATEAMRREQVMLNGRTVKPSAEVRTGDTFALRTPPVWRSWEVLQMPSSRVGARLVPGIIAERTSFADRQKLEMVRAARALNRAPGQGRPTKRDRRAIERLGGA
jgi:ribosome-associated heat shock protein Hsp15